MRIWLKYSVAILILVIIYSAIPTLGQEGTKDSLNYYLENAAKNNPTVLQRFYEYQASLQKIPQVGSLPDPDLTIGVFVKPMELVMGNQTADVKLMQMFPWFGLLKYARDEMSLMAKAKYESFREAKHQVFYDIRTAWYVLYRLNQDLLISEKNLRILNTIERLALVRYRTASGLEGGPSSSQPGRENTLQSPGVSSASQEMQGMSSSKNAQAVSNMNSSSMQEGSMPASQKVVDLADLYRIQIEISNLENSIELLKNQKSTITAKFNSYLNRPMLTTVTIADTLIPEVLNISLVTITDTILKNNPMLGMLQLERQALDARKKMVTKMGYPMVGLGLDYSLINKSDMVASSENGKDMIMPMVSISLPVYRKKYRAMQSETDILSASTDQNYTSAANALKSEYYQAAQLYQDAERRIKLYSNQYLLAKKSLELLIMSFSTAGSPLSEILSLQQQTLDFELKKAESVTDFNTAVAWLKKLEGSGD